MYLYTAVKIGAAVGSVEVFTGYVGLTFSSLKIQLRSRKDEVSGSCYNTIQ